MSQHLIVQKISPEVEAQLSELSHQKSVLAQIGPRIIRDYSTTINGRVYIHVAGATLVAAVFGFSVRERSNKRIEVDGVGGWEAVCEITRDGVSVGRGSGLVMDDERMWSTRPQFARRAMASTRAAGRALRLFFGHMLPMLGDKVASTTVEEMPNEEE